MKTADPAQVDFFEKKIEELEAQRQRYVDDLGHSLRRDRTIYLYLDAFDDEIRRCRRALAWITGDES